MKLSILIIMLAVACCETLREVSTHPTQVSSSAYGTDMALYDNCIAKSKDVGTSGKLTDCTALSKPANHNLCCGIKLGTQSSCVANGEAYLGISTASFSANNLEVNCGPELADYITDIIACGKAGINFPKDGAADICNKVTLKESGSVCCRGVITADKTGSCYAMNNYTQVGIAAKSFDALFLAQFTGVQITCPTAYDDLVKGVNACAAVAGKTKEDCGKSTGTGFTCCYVNSKCLAVASKDAPSNPGCDVKKSSSSRLEIMIWLFVLVLLVLV